MVQGFRYIKHKEQYYRGVPSLIFQATDTTIHLFAGDGLGCRGEEEQGRDKEVNLTG